MSNAPIKIIDPHLHLFNLQQGNYAWLKPQNPPFWPDKQLINKDFRESDLRLYTDYKLAGFVHIEAGFDNQKPWREIEYLEQHCLLPFKSVAFADITSTNFEKQIMRLTIYSSVVGIRHILDEQALAILTAASSQGNLGLLAEKHLSFDAQLSVTDQPAVDKITQLAHELPALKIIINHGGWPPISAHSRQQENWQKNIQKLAKCPNIALKISGLEMQERNWQLGQLIKVINDSLAAFGDKRVMLASNFPLCLFSQSYAKLWSNYQQLPNLSSAFIKQISYNNAKYWYKFD
ncbi:amidohydrolase family protein [Paraglaciecola aestuariivivens]